MLHSGIQFASLLAIDVMPQLFYNQMADFLDTHSKFYDKFIIYILCSDASI